MNKEHEAWLLQQLADLDATKARLAEAEAAAKTWENEAERRSRRYEKAAARLAEAEALLREEIREHHRFTQMTEYPSVTRMLLWHMDRKRRIDAFLAPDSASVCLHQIHNGDTCEICGAKVTPVVQPERCCVDYPRCDCNSPPESEGAE